MMFTARWDKARRDRIIVNACGEVRLIIVGFYTIHVFTLYSCSL